jgi:hypothetical protein
MRRIHLLLFVLLRYSDLFTPAHSFTPKAGYFPHLSFARHSSTKEKRLPFIRMPSQKAATTSPEPDIIDNVATDADLSMPWSDLQDWALQDKLPKYIVMIKLTKNGKEKTEAYALWRTMLNEVMEVAGYPIDFLQDMHSRYTGKKESVFQVTPGLLPYLDEFQFAAAGGISGKVYGVPGLADGTKIETSAVDNIQITLPKGFIRTSDGSAAYELGRPAREKLASPSLEQLADGSGTILNTISNVGAKVATSTTAAASNTGTEEDADKMLVRLGATTGILLAGATAFNMVAHHLTVNVFWV